MDQGAPWFLGASPFNSYYTVERIQDLITVALHYTSKVYFFVADELSYYNFISQGYTLEKAKQKSARKDQNLRNRVHRALENLGLEKDPNIIVLQYSTLKHHPLYPLYLEKYKALLADDLLFKEMVFEVLKNLKTTHEFTDLNIAQNYFLEELPTFLNLPSLLDIPHCCCIYHYLFPFVHYIYNEKKLNEIGNGFAAVEFLPQE